VTAKQSTIVVRPADETICVSLRKLDTLMAEASELLVAKMREERQREINRLRKLHSPLGARMAHARAPISGWRGACRTTNAGRADGAVQIPRNQPEDTCRNRTANWDRLQATAQDYMRLSLLADQLQSDIGGCGWCRSSRWSADATAGARPARDTSKQIQFDVDGGVVELDKSVLDSLKEPIMHLLRNAADHGLEAPDERERKGKSPVGASNRLGTARQRDRPARERRRQGH
jgi:two-component system chemotaxis sensor kinase CheA